MAGEITVTVGLIVDKSYLHELHQLQIQADMSGSVSVGGAVTVTTTAAALAMGSVSSAGWAFFRNLDATNYVEIGKDVTGTFANVIKLKPGECAVLRLATNAPYARANTASVVLQYLILQD